ncbi:MAG: STAS domain-containing protein [Pleurocapsa sp.]
MEIKTENYKVLYDDKSNNIIFDGSLRLNGTAEYASITELLNNVAQQEPEKIILDLKELNFLNSSGISILSKFVINIRRRKKFQMVAVGAK